MSLITKLFERVNLQHIREFLLHGVECCNIQNGDYETRIETAEKNYQKMLLEHIPDLKDDSELSYELSNLLTEYENVYMELGMQVGIMLTEEFKNITGSRT